METIPRTGTFGSAGALGNFLSGMETRTHPRPLGNFLSGMETSGGAKSSTQPYSALETSLVEWKRQTRKRESSRRNALETSLVEWKLAALRASITSMRYLGNFLSGMETKVREMPEEDLTIPWKLP